ncbi:hypothetical protein PMIN05_010864 [Paraphaeosphaeria minitans]
MTFSNNRTSIRRSLACQGHFFWAALYLGLGERDPYNLSEVWSAGNLDSTATTAAWHVVIDFTAYTKINTTISIVSFFLDSAYLARLQRFRDRPFYRHTKISLICL